MDNPASRALDRGGAAGAGAGNGRGAGAAQPAARKRTASVGCRAGDGTPRRSLGQRDVLLDYQIRRQALDVEPRPRLELLRALELAGAHGGVHALLDLALRGDAEVLQEVAHGEVERFVVHGVTFKT